MRPKQVGVDSNNGLLMLKENVGPTFATHSPTAVEITRGYTLWVIESFPCWIDGNGKESGMMGKCEPSQHG